MLENTPAILIIIYLLINSFLFMLNMAENLVSKWDALKIWAITMFFGIPYTIYLSIPRWNWFFDNVWFWITLRFTDRWANLSQEHIDLAKKYYADKPQFKAMCKKYNY